MSEQEELRKLQKGLSDTILEYIEISKVVISNQQIEISSLKSENERLRKVGDRLANAFKNQKLYMQMLICTTDEYIGKELPKVDYEALSEWEKGK